MGIWRMTGEWLVSKIGWRDNCNSYLLQKHRDTVTLSLKRGLNVRLLSPEYLVFL